MKITSTITIEKDYNFNEKDKSCNIENLLKKLAKMQNLPEELELKEGILRTQEFGGQIPSHIKTLEALIGHIFIKTINNSKTVNNIVYGYKFIFYKKEYTKEDIALIRRNICQNHSKHEQS